LKWYVINVLSGYESKAADTIQKELDKKKLDGLVEEIFIPSEMVTRISKGKKVKVEKKFYPGYIFIKADMSEELWSIIKSVAKVSGPLQAGGRPLIVREREVEEVKKQLESGVSISDLGVHFDVAESVKITDGAFKSFIGVVEEIDAERHLLKVSVSIFGRNTPVELGFNQVEKM